MKANILAHWEIRMKFTKLFLFLPNLTFFVEFKSKSTFIQWSYLASNKSLREKIIKYSPHKLLSFENWKSGNLKSQILFSSYDCVWTSAWTSSLYIEFEFHRVSNCRVRACIKLDFCSSVGSSNEFFRFFRARV